MIPLPSVSFPSFADSSPSVSSFKKIDSHKGSKAVALGKKNAALSLSQHTQETAATRSDCTVSFSKRVRVKKIRSHKLYDETERTLTWYSPDEYTSIKKGCIDTLKLMQKQPAGAFNDTDEYSSRGLEIRTKPAQQARKENKAFAAHAVFDEQELQDEEGTRDVERIRAAYLEVAAPSRHEAHRMAMQDQAEAEKIHKKDSSSSGKKSLLKLGSLRIR